MSDDKTYVIEYRTVFTGMPLPGVLEFIRRQQVDGGWTALDAEALLRGQTQVRNSREGGLGAVSTLKVRPV